MRWAQVILSTLSLLLLLGGPSGMAFKAAGPTCWLGLASSMPRPHPPALAGMGAFIHRAHSYVARSAHSPSLCALNNFASRVDFARRGSVAGVAPAHRCSPCLRRVPLSMSDSSTSGDGKKIEQARRRMVQPQSTDPQEAMKRWSKMLIKTGQESVDDLKMKTIRALDNLFSGGFMHEGTCGENDMLPVLRKFMMNDFEGYSPPQVAASLAEDFRNYGAPQLLTAPSLKDDAAPFEAGGADLTGWGRTQQGMDGDELKLDRLQPLDRQQFSQAVQAGIGTMALEDIDLVFDEIDKDGDGTLTLAELYDTYKAVQAEIVTDQEIGVRDVELAATKLRPATPDAAFSNLLSAPGDKTGVHDAGLSSSMGAHADISTRMQEWDTVCEVLSTQSAYLPDEGREMLEQAVQFSSQLLLADMSEGGGNNFGDGLALGGIVAGLQSQSEAVTAAVLLPAFRTGAVESVEVRERFGPVVASIVDLPY